MTKYRQLKHLCYVALGDRRLLFKAPSLCILAGTKNMDGNSAAMGVACESIASGNLTTAGLRLSIVTLEGGRRQSTLDATRTEYWRVKSKKIYGRGRCGHHGEMWSKTCSAIAHPRLNPYFEGKPYKQTEPAGGVIGGRLLTLRGSLL